MAKALWVVARREARMLLTEKTLVIAVLIQLFVASFSAFLTIGFAVMFSPAAISPGLAGHLQVGVVGGDTQIEASLMEIMMRHMGIRQFDTLEAAQQALSSGRLDGILNIKAAPVNSSGPFMLEMYLPANNFKSTLVTVQVKKALEQFQAQLRADRNVSVIEFAPPGEAKDVARFFEFKYSVLVPLLILLPAFLSGGMIIDMITEEYELGTVDLLRVSPLKFPDVIYGKMVVMVLIAPLQAAAWIWLMGLNRIQIYNVPEILLFLTLVTLILVQAGSLLSMYLKQRSSVHLAFSAVFVLLVLLCGLLRLPPMNFVALLAAGSGVDMLDYLWYAAAAVFLHIWIKFMPEM